MKLKKEGGELGGENRGGGKDGKRRKTKMRSEESKLAVLKVDNGEI